MILSPIETRLLTIDLRRLCKTYSFPREFGLQLVYSSSCIQSDSKIDATPPSTTDIFILNRILNIYSCLYILLFIENFIIYLSSKNNPLTSKVIRTKVLKFQSCSNNFDGISNLKIYTFLNSSLSFQRY